MAESVFENDWFLSVPRGTFAWRFLIEHQRTICEHND